MSRRRVRSIPVTAAVVLALLGTLTGCTMALPPDSSATPIPSATPTASGSASPTVEITLQDGDLLDPSQTAVWADPLAGADGYSVLTADEGDGSWSYKSDRTGCIVGYWHGPLGDTSAGGDDSALSDELLAAQFGTTADEVAGFVQNDAAPFRTPSELVQTRAVAGADEETATTYLVAARAFSALGEGFVATLRCPATTNVQAMWSLLSSDPNAFQLVFSQKPAG
ncbi:hypothetical protein G5T42_14050 [Microbacterium sp. 4R-513]|uniref:hypothetical protein n=1 Tax=Microbacterium sp. 4R-513 TaxID=2567934 RepID=UPI0013E128D1|nr:hypothetical protein [Microbacterium sp. 4R-513]QIG40456.1 hypothetical protein G5T42_14050 [Microbacterium sp. 4R-513]